MVQLAPLCLLTTTLIGSAVSTTWKSLKPIAEFKKELDKKNQKLGAEVGANSKTWSKGPVNDSSNGHHQDMDMAAKLRNAVIKVAAKPVFPYIVLQNKIGTDGENITQLTGFVGDIWAVLEEQFGFKTDFRPMEGNTTLSFKKWDVLLNPKEYNSVRKKNTRSTFPITKIWYHIFNKGKHDTRISWYYFQILDKKLWAGISALIIALSICLWIVWKVRTAMLMKNRETTRDINYLTCLLSVLGCMINQGSQFKNESTPSIRIITLATIILGLLITTSFSALLISKLATVDTVRAEPISLTSLMRNPGQKTLCVAKSGYAYKQLTDWMKRKRKTSLELNGHLCTQGVFDYVPSRDLCVDDAVTFETMFNVDYALQTNPVSNDEECPIFVNNYRYFNTYLTLTVKYDFPYLKLINKHLLRMEESGLLAKIENRWKPIKNPKKNNLETTNYIPSVRFDHIRSIALLYSVAVGVSIFILAAERVYKFLKDKWPLFQFSKLIYQAYKLFGFRES